MKPTVIFEEVQFAVSRSIRGAARILLGIVFLAIITNLIIGKGSLFGFNSILVIIFPVLLAGSIILESSLITEITEEGIRVRFPPFQPSFTCYEWKNIEQIYARDFNPAKEFLGWGIRTGPGRKGYVIGGKAAIEVIFKNGTRLLITTRQKDHVNGVLRKMRKL